MDTLMKLLPSCARCGDKVIEIIELADLDGQDDSGISSSAKELTKTVFVAVAEYISDYVDVGDVDEQVKTDFSDFTKRVIKKLPNPNDKSLGNDVAADGIYSYIGDIINEVYEEEIINLQNEHQLIYMQILSTLKILSKLSN